MLYILFLLQVVLRRLHKVITVTVQHFSEYRTLVRLDRCSLGTFCTAPLCRVAGYILVLLIILFLCSGLYAFLSELEMNSLMVGIFVESCSCLRGVS